MKLTHVSLCSGIGGIDLAAEWAGFTTVAQCEIDEYASKVLAKNFKGVPNLHDIRTVTRVTLFEEVYMAQHRKDYDHAVEMYNMGMSIENIAEYYGVSRQSMWKCLQRRGVKFRDNKRYGAENHFYRGTKANEMAHDVVERALGKGILVRPTTCEICGKSGMFSDGRSMIQAHHTDYNKPLDVMWICQKCHHEWHKNHKAKEVVPNGSMGTAVDGNSSETDGSTVTVLSAGFP